MKIKNEVINKDQQESYENAKIYCICKEKIEDKHVKDKKYRKSWDHVSYASEYKDVVHSICNLKYSVTKKIPIVLHNGSNYDYHFIIKENAENFERQFTYLGENTEKYITFSV